MPHHLHDKHVHVKHVHTESKSMILSMKAATSRKKRKWLAGWETVDKCRQNIHVLCLVLWVSGLLKVGFILGCKEWLSASEVPGMYMHRQQLPSFGPLSPPRALWGEAIWHRDTTAHAAEEQAKDNPAANPLAEILLNWCAVLADTTYKFNAPHWWVEKHSECWALSRILM